MLEHDKAAPHFMEVLQKVQVDSKTQVAIPSELDKKWTQLSAFAASFAELKADCGQQLGYPLVAATAGSPQVFMSLTEPKTQNLRPGDTRF